MTDRHKEREIGSYSSEESSEDTKRGKKRNRVSQSHTNHIEKDESESNQKKKKEQKTTHPPTEDDFEDIIERGWFYIDSNGEKQGPFSTKEMKEWFIAGFFNNDLLVKRVSDTSFTRIAEREEFTKLERKPHLASYAAVSLPSYEQRVETENTPNPFYQDFPSYYDASFEPEQTPEMPIGADDDPSSYTQAAFFTTLGGRFSGGDQTSHWKKKGLPTDKDGRMLSHYLDVEAYQEQMRNAEPPKKKKITKNMIKFYKKRKEDRKRRRALML